MSKVVPFPGRKPKGAYREAVQQQARGSIEIWPSEDMGGSWAVWHRSSSGDSLGHWGSFLSFDDADREARLAAQHYGAVYDGGAHV
jgi:hypothetical protein